MRKKDSQYTGTEAQYQTGVEDFHSNHVATNSLSRRTFWLMRSPLHKIPLEALALGGGVVVVILLGSVFDSGVSFCLSRVLGLGECWGCGLGRSIMHISHGDLAASFSAHPLGIPAIIVVIGRIFHLVRRSRTQP